MHYGAMRLDVKRGARRALSGTYWTDRGSYGKLELLERNKNIVDGFERAKQLFTGR